MHCKMCSNYESYYHYVCGVTVCVMNFKSSHVNNISAVVIYEHQ